MILLSQREESWMTWEPTFEERQRVVQELLESDHTGRISASAL